MATRSFNPRARVGRDASSSLPNSSTTLFQSTRPRGARLLSVKDCPQRMSFNPRARVGRDLRLSHPWTVLHCFNPRARVGRDSNIRVLQLMQRDVSIHAPAWGATRAELRFRAGGGVSIHAPAWGATLRRSLRRMASVGFNPRARVGRDALCASVRVQVAVSIHAPAWGATATIGDESQAFWGFNPRARVGRDGGHCRRRSES